LQKAGKKKKTQEKTEELKNEIVGKQNGVS
jgi:hypothetical protein